MYEYENIKVTNESGIVTVTLNRPSKKNAMSPALHLDMDDVLSKLADDPEVDVFILTGAGDSFCAGMDLEKFFFEQYGEPERFDKAARTAISLYTKLRNFPKPTIACVNGWCFGGGFNLVMTCDLAIASEDAKFGLSEINFGSIPSGGATWTVAYGLLPRHAMYLILTGDMIDAGEAAQMGLINKAVPAERLWEETWALAEKLQKKNPIAVRFAKEVFRESKWMDLQKSFQWELAKAAEFRYLQKNEWMEEGIKQFRDKKYKPGLGAYKRPE